MKRINVALVGLLPAFCCLSVMTFRVLTGCRDTSTLHTGVEDRANHDVSCRVDGLLGPDSADPDVNDMSIWQQVEPGIHSGFGSLDIAYSKSVPPNEDVTDSIRLQGWKGERVNCKLLIWSSDSEEHITLTTDGLQNNHFKIGRCIRFASKLKRPTQIGRQAVIQVQGWIGVVNLFT